MATKPNSMRNDELPEYPFVGPFGGINSEMPIDKIGRTGFLEVQNIIFRKSQAQLLGAFQPLARPMAGTQILNLVGTISALTGSIAALSAGIPDGPVIGIADFFNVNGTRCFVIWTPTRMYQWNGLSWLQINGTLSGSATQFMSWDVVGYDLYFSQGQDNVSYWDGIATSFNPGGAITNAVPAKYLCELDFHLLAANCVVSGASSPNTMFWSGIGNGQDWSSYSAGSNNLFNGLGPINGLGRIYQAGYVFQQWGITQIVPTGIGLAPFQFIPMGSRAKGSILPNGVATFGEVISAYVGKDDVYVFDGTESNGIGSKPIDGNRRVGARARIFSDLYTTSLANVTGFINTSDNGVDYESYWLLIPSLNKAWVYHFDEQSWTQIYFNPGQLQGPTGIFNGSQSSSPEIEQLVGTIAQQSWTFAGLTNSAPLDTMAISDANANSISLLSPNQPSSFPTVNSINPTDGWYIGSGKLTFDDPRHYHTIKKIRVGFIDTASNLTFYMRVTSENGQTALQTVTTSSTGSGNPLVRVLGFAITGKFLKWEISGPQGVNFTLTEVTPIYSVEGEIRDSVSPTTV